MRKFIFTLFIMMFSIVAIGQMGNIRTQKIDVIVPNSMPELTIDADLDVYGPSEFQDDITMTGTGALKLPVGTDAQRPTPAQGMFRYNTDQANFEGYNGTIWAAIGGGSVFTDAFITLNDGNDQANADGTGGLLITMTDATDVALNYDSGVASQFVMGEIGDQHEVVTTGHTQSLVDKTIDLSSIINPLSIQVKLGTQAQLETHAATAVNGELAYATDTKDYYGFTDNALVDLGGGGGGFNYIENPTPKIDTSGWTRYATTSPNAVPVDFAGVPNGAVTWTRNTTNALNNVSDFLLTKDANNRQGEGIYYEFDIRNGDRTVMQLLRALKLDSANYTDADISLFLVTSSDGFATQNIIYPANQDLLAGTPDTLKQFQFNSTDTEGRLCIHISSTNALAYTVQFNDFAFAQSPVATSALRLDDKEYVPATTQGLGTIASTDLFHDVDGEYINISGRLVIGTPTAVEARIALPDGMVSSSAIPTLEIAGVYGQGNVGVVSGYVSIEPSKTYFVFTIQNAGNGALTKQNGSAIFGAGVTVSIKARIKIEGQSSNAASSIDLGARDIVLNLVGSGATQSITDNSATKATNWTVSEDTVAGWDSVNSRYSISEGGYFDISASAIFSSDAGNDVASQRCDIYKNGSLLFRGEVGTNTLIANRYQPAVNVKAVRLERGDYLEVFVYQDNSSGNANNLTGATTSQWLQVAKNASPQTMLAAQSVYGNYTKTDAQAIANNTVTSVIWNTTVETTNANWMNTSTGELTLGENGNYQFNAGASLVSATTGTGVVFLEIYKNGTRVSRGVVNGIDDGGAGSLVSHSMYCNKNDVITTRIVHTNGVSRNLSTTAGVNTFSYHRTN